MSAHAAGVHHRDLVDGHLGGRSVAGDELAAAARAQLGDALERPVPEVRVEELEQLLGRLPRAPRRLELEPRVVGGELQLPDTAPALDAAPEGDARGRERASGHVVVDGGEDARLERPAAERRQPEADRSVELALVLARCPHASRTYGPANELGQLLPRCLGLLLEAGRVHARGLEQELPPSLVVDLLQQLVDGLPVTGGVVAARHAASCELRGLVLHRALARRPQEDGGDDDARRAAAAEDVERGLEAVDGRAARSRSTSRARARSSDVALAAMVLIAASPIAPPICRLVFTSPEATPASARSTPVRLAIVIGTKEKPIPAPPSTKAGKMSQK